MKLVGLIGGVSPEATQIYYQHLNAHMRASLGGQHSANTLLYALDYGVMIEHYTNNNWPAFIDEVVEGAECLKAAGVAALAITSGTTHVGADAAAEATGLPVIHMLDSLTAALVDGKVEKPLLLGTAFTMSGHFFRPALAERYHGDASPPSTQDQTLVEHIIMTELVEGVVTPASRTQMVDLVKRYQSKGHDGVILGCTELCMILEPADCDSSVFDVTAIHTEAIAGEMLR